MRDYTNLEKLNQMFYIMFGPVASYNCYLDTFTAQ